MTRRQLWWTLALTVAALAVAASANTIVNGFTYDDNYVVVRAARSHTLNGWWRQFGKTYWPEFWGGDGYRPLTVIGFQLQWVMGGGKPMLFHVVNVALHCATAVAVFWMASGLLPLAAAFVAGALFAVHPVHVEAIAGAVGMAELAVGLLVTLAVAVYVHGRLAGTLTWRRWLAITMLYALACFFKEHGIVLPALIMLVELLFPENKPLRVRLAAIRPGLLVLGLVAAAYLWARSRVVADGGSGFVPFIAAQVLEFSTTDRVLTMIGGASEWLRLFLWPARLQTEYSPPSFEIAQGPGIGQLAGALVLLGTLGLIVACWRRSPMTSLGIAWTAIAMAPVSNFFVAAGFIIAERTLYLPSVGAVIAVASVVPWLYERFESRPVAQFAGAGALAALIALGLARSYTRNRVWRDNETLFRQGVVDSPDNYRAHYVLGSHFFETQRVREGERHYRKALELFPYDPIVMYYLAEQYRKVGMCEPAIPLYRAAFELAPGIRRWKVALSACLIRNGDTAEARRVALDALRWGADLSTVRRLIAGTAVTSDHDR